jgi:uncharacterized protein
MMMQGLPMFSGIERIMNKRSGIRLLEKLALATGILLLCLHLSSCTSERPTGTEAVDKMKVNKTEPVVDQPLFVKEGDLWFIGDEKAVLASDTLAHIDIEVSATDAERMKGLMYRTNIAETTGMIFFFKEAGLQYFWMKNTPSSLDIIYVDPTNRILNIHEFTAPYSTQNYASTGKADKVVEVKGGFCQKNKIKAGDRIAYTTASEVKIEGESDGD